jgi:hypothetical protein
MSTHRLDEEGYSKRAKRRLAVRAAQLWTCLVSGADAPPSQAMEVWAGATRFLQRWQSAQSGIAWVLVPEDDQETLDVLACVQTWCARRLGVFLAVTLSQRTGACPSSTPRPAPIGRTRVRRVAIELADDRRWRARTVVRRPILCLCIMYVPMAMRGVGYSLLLLKHLKAKFGPSAALRQELPEMTDLFAWGANVRAISHV